MNSSSEWKLPIQSLNEPSARPVLSRMLSLDEQNASNDSLQGELCASALLVETPMRTQRTLYYKPRRPSAPLQSPPSCKTDEYLEIQMKSEAQLIELMNDRKPCLQLRKALLRVKMGVNTVCLAVVTHKVFETCVILMILANTVTLALENPTASEQDPTLVLLDSVFLYFYTIEALLKIGAFGFMCNKGSYLRDKWNILDFAIVLAGWTERIVNEGVNLNALRTLRILRPLRSISSIEGLRVIIAALINSIWQLLISVFLFMFFVCIFSIAGVHL